MRNLEASLTTLEQKNTKSCSTEQKQAFNDILSYLDRLAERKACGYTQVQAEIEVVNKFLKAQ